MEAFANTAPASLQISTCGPSCPQPARSTREEFHTVIFIPKDKQKDKIKVTEAEVKVCLLLFDWH